MSKDQNMDSSSNPTQQPSGYMPCPTQPDDSNSQNQMPSQLPTVLPRPDLVKDDKKAEKPWGDFTDVDSNIIRRVFIRKVYSILMIQLAITFGLIALCHFIPSIREYVRNPNGRWLYFTSYAVFLITYFVLICSKNAARKFPLNLILLGILTLSMGYMMGMISAYYKTESVLIAVGITAFVCLGVTLFSFQTKYDFTVCTGVLLVLSLAILAFAIVCIFTYSRIMYTIFAGLGAALFLIFLAVDTQLIIGGKRLEINAEDHIFASLMLYMDIINIFLYILALFGGRK